MADAPNLNDAVANSADGPRTIGVQGMGQSEEFPLTDKIAAAKFLPPGNIRRRTGGGMKFSKMQAGGAVE
jgi:hypothetical protein